MDVVLAALGQQVLQHIVAVGVVGQAVGGLVQLFQGVHQLGLRAVLQQALHHAAAVRVHRNAGQAARQRLQNLGPLLRRRHLDA